MPRNFSSSAKRLLFRRITKIFMFSNSLRPQASWYTMTSAPAQRSPEANNITRNLFLSFLSWLKNGNCSADTEEILQSVQHALSSYLDLFEYFLNALVFSPCYVGKLNNGFNVVAQRFVFTKFE